MGLKKHTNLLLIIVATAVLIALISYADVEEFLDTLGSADPLFLGLTFFVSLLHFPILALVWHIFLKSEEGYNESFAYTLKLLAAGKFLNGVTPFGQAGGEPVIAYTIKDKTKISFTAALSSLVVSDLTGYTYLLTLLIAGLGLYLITGFLEGLIQVFLVIFLLIISLGLVVILILYGSHRANVMSVVSGFLREKWINRIHNLEESIQELESKIITKLKDRKRVASAIILGHIGYLVWVAVLIGSLISLGITYNIFVILLAVPIASLSRFIGVPGGIGAYPAVLATVLTAGLSIGFSEALAAALLFRLITYWIPLLIGYIVYVVISAR